MGKEFLFALLVIRERVIRNLHLVEYIEEIGFRNIISFNKVKLAKHDFKILVRNINFYPINTFFELLNLDFLWLWLLKKSWCLLIIHL